MARVFRTGRLLNYLVGRNGSSTVVRACSSAPKKHVRPVRLLLEAHCHSLSILLTSYILTSPGRLDHSCIVVVFAPVMYY